MRNSRGKVHMQISLSLLQTMEANMAIALKQWIVTKPKQPWVLCCCTDDRCRIACVLRDCIKSVKCCCSTLNLLFYAFIIYFVSTRLCFAVLTLNLYLRIGFHCEIASINVYLSLGEHHKSIEVTVLQLTVRIRRKFLRFRMANYLKFQQITIRIQYH